MNLKIKRIIPVIICIVLLICAVGISGLKKQSAQKSGSVSAPKKEAATADSAEESDEEMRGVWVTYMELSMENEADKSEKSFRAKFDKIAENAKKMGFNTLIAQVRPFCDALYNSAYFPHSHILSGTQGEYAGYDALKIMCEISKKYGLKIHAWINPYRVMLSETPAELADNNPCYYDDPICIETDSQIILDPSSETARDLIINGIEEIVKNYDVDGIQFDDYFYPADIDDNDSEQYEAYLETANPNNAMELSDWRKNNVNLLVAQAYITVHNQNKDIEFGISPQGNLGNNNELAADVVSWCGSNGYIDYICPQIYFSLSNPKLSFEASLSEWCDLDFSDEVKLYIGLAGYKANSDADEGTWLGSDDILSKEYAIAKANKNVSGIMLYSSSSLTDEDKNDEINNLIKSFG